MNTLRRLGVIIGLVASIALPSSVFAADATSDTTESLSVASTRCELACRALRADAKFSGTEGKGCSAAPWW